MIGRFGVAVQLALLGVASTIVVWPAAGLATRGPQDPKEAFRKQDQAWAKRITLKRRDLPVGAKWVPYGTGGSGGGAAGSQVGCPGVRSDDSDLTLTGRATSPLFLGNRGQFVLFSAVWIYKTHDQARKFVERLDRGLSRCGPGLMKEEAGKKKGVRLVSFGARSIARIGEQSAVFRLVISLPVNGQRLKSYVDFAFIHRGRTTLWALFRGIPAPIPDEVELGLLRLFAARMVERR